MPSDDARRPLRVLRSFTRGLLLLDGAYSTRRFVLDPETGRPVLTMPAEWDPGEPDGPEGDGAVLYLPDDSRPELQLVVHPEPIEGRTHAAAERWQAYHGTARESGWAALRIESARLPEAVCDGEDVMSGNPLRGAETRLLRELNADRVRLTRLCERVGGVRPQSPTAVGIDPDGLDVRASLGIVRIEFPDTAGSEAEVRRTVSALLGDAP